MSRFRKALKEQREQDGARKAETVVNFMGGESYVVGALATLKMLTASSIFGEPSYYRDGGLGGRKIQDSRYTSCKLLEGYLMERGDWEGRTTTQIMEEAIDLALSEGLWRRWSGRLR